MTTAEITAVNAHLAGTQVAPLPLSIATDFDPSVGTGAAMMAPNWAGKMMKAAPGTATPGQQAWQIANSRITAKGAAKLSMVEASNRRARIEGRI